MDTLLIKIESENCCVLTTIKLLEKIFSNLQFSRLSFLF